jgi:hypothetical protein
MRASSCADPDFPALAAGGRWPYCLCPRSRKAACTASCAAAPRPLPAVFTPTGTAPRVVARWPLWWPRRPRLAARRPEPAARSSRRRRPRPAAPMQLHAHGYRRPRPRPVRSHASRLTASAWLLIPLVVAGEPGPAGGSRASLELERLRSRARPTAAPLRLTSYGGACAAPRQLPPATNLVFPVDRQEDEWKQ